MKILFYISHPAQFLFFKNSIRLLKKNDHKLFILIRTKGVLSKLLDEEGLEYYNILPVERKKNRWGIIKSLVKRELKLFTFLLKYKVDLLIGTDACLAHNGQLFRIPVITTLEDDYDVIKNLAKITYPFSSHILVPGVCDVGRKWEEKKVAYSGYMKLAYLHPNWFTPNSLKLNGHNGQPFYLLRLSGLKAHHDFGAQGICFTVLDKIISKLSKRGKVYISSEDELPESYERHQLKIPVSDMHHYLYYADLLICDSQSMSVEAAMLGTPSIRVSSFSGRINVLEELEHTYGLTFGIKPEHTIKIFKKIDELLSIDNFKDEFRNRRHKMLKDKIDVTSFLVWFIENYPNSVKNINMDKYRFIEPKEKLVENYNN